jgi:hypothetical protein
MVSIEGLACGNTPGLATQARHLTYGFTCRRGIEDRHVGPDVAATELITCS